MKKRLLALLQGEIYMLERAIKTERKYKELERRLAQAKKDYAELEQSYITKVKPAKGINTIEPEKRKRIIQHILNGEKNSWIILDCKTTYRTVSNVKKELEKKRNDRPQL